MSNRQQRRAAKHRGKRPGETYADVLAKKKMIEEAVRESVHDTSIAMDLTDFTGITGGTT